MDRSLLFKCPRTGMNVQHWLTGAASHPADTHVAVPCPACASLHFVNLATGKLLIAERDQQPAPKLPRYRAAQPSS